MKRTNETALVRQLLDYLRLRGIPAWRNNTGAAVAEYKGRKRLVRFGTKGASDILAVLPPDGRLLAVEAKAGRGRPTPDQLAFLENVRAAGGLALVARSLEDLEQALGPGP